MNKIKRILCVLLSFIMLFVCGTDRLVQVHAEEVSRTASYSILQFLSFENNLGIGSVKSLWDFLYIEPLDAQGSPLTFSKYDSNILTIDSDYKLHAVGVGATEVEVTADNGVSASAWFYVLNTPSSVENFQYSQVRLTVGEDAQLKYRMDPEGNYGETVNWIVHWTEPEGCLTVDQNGYVTTNFAGDAYVEAQIIFPDTQYSLSYSIYVSENPTSLSFTKSPSYLPLGASFDIRQYLDIKPDEAVQCKLTIESKDQDIVSPSGNGFIYGNNSGDTEVTVTAGNGVSATAHFIVGDYAHYINNYDESYAELLPGDTHYFTYVLQPSDGRSFADEKVTWSIEQMTNNCISLDADTGEIKALSPGNATVRAEILLGSFITYDVKVMSAIDTVRFNENPVTLTYQEVRDITDFISYEPSDGALSTLKVTSSRPDIILVDGTSLTAQNRGTAVITVETQKGNQFSADFKVARYADSIGIVGDYSIYLKPKETRQLGYALYPSGETFDDVLTWGINYNNNDCITLSANGEVTAVRAGDASVYVRNQNWMQAEYHITVYDNPDSIRFLADPVGVRVGYNYFLRHLLEIQPASAQECPVTFTSSDPSVISINSDGSMNVLKDGNAEVTAETAYGLKAVANFVTGKYAYSISNPDSSFSMCAESQKQLIVYLDPTSDNGNLSDEQVTWSVQSGQDCVTVDQNGLVNALKAGSAEVKAQIRNGRSLIFHITVLPAPTEIKFNRSTIMVKPYTSFWIQDYMTFTPEETKWAAALHITSSNLSAIGVEGSGYLYTTGSGSSEITVTLDNGLSAKAVFIVGSSAEDIYIDNPPQKMTVGEKVKAGYTLYPTNEDHSAEEIVWTVEDGKDVVSVDETGWITGLKYGTARIRATIMNGRYSEFYVTVYDKPTRIKFEKNHYYVSIYSGSMSIRNYLSVEPYTADSYGFTVTSGDSDIISVSDDSISPLNKPGSTTITVTTPNGLRAEAEFTVGYYATSISPGDFSTNLYLKPTASEELKYVLEPNDGRTLADEQITWTLQSTYPKNCVTLDENGKVYAVKPGSAYVLATTRNGSTLSYNITVFDEPSLLKFKQEHLYLSLHNEFDIWSYLTVLPARARNCDLTLTSSDPGVVEIMNNRRLHSLSPGNAVITLETENNLTASIPVTVGNYADYITIDRDSSWGMSLLLHEGRALGYSMGSFSGNPTGDETVTWSVVNDPDHAVMVSPNGYVTAVNCGTAIVEARLTSGASSNITINVVRKPERITIEKPVYYVSQNSGQTIHADILPLDAQNAGLIWKSSDESVIAVLSNGPDQGYVSYRGDGEATIRAESPYDSTVYAECKVIGYTNTPATAVKTASAMTGYKGYFLRIPVSLEPATAKDQLTAEVNNDNASVFFCGLGYVMIDCLKPGNVQVTVRAADSTASANVDLTILDAQPANLDATAEICQSRAGTNIGTVAKNPEQYTCIVGNEYSFYAVNRFNNENIADQTAFVDNEDIISQLSLFEVYGHGASSTPDGYRAGAAGTAVLAGTCELELIKGRKIQIRVADYAEADNTVSVDAGIDQQTAQSVSQALAQNDDSLGLADALQSAAAGVEIPADVEVSNNEKIVVETHLDININDIKTESDGSATLAVAIEPMYQLKAVTEGQSGGRNLTEAQPLEVNNTVTVTIPVGNAFAGKNVQTVLVRHIKDDGTEYIYTGTYENNAVTFVNPNGFSDFEITVTEDVFSEPVYTWTETDDGYEVRAEAFSETSENKLSETVKAEKTIDLPATCTQGSYTVYEAFFSNSMFAVQTKEVRGETVPHQYELKRWEWNGDLSEAYAVFACGQCGDETRIKADIAESEDEIIATVVFEGWEYTDRRSAEGPGPETPQISLTEKEITLSAGSVKQLIASAVMVDEIVWTSSDRTVAAVNENGLVTAISAGTAVIRAASASDETIYDECTVKVPGDIVVHSAALAMEGTLKINFYVTMPAEMEDSTYFRMTVGADTEGILVHASEAGKDSSGRIRLTCPFFSTQMRDTVRLTAEDSDGHRKPMTTASGKDVTEGLEYSALTYIKNKENGSDAKLAALVKAMNNYGKYAQKYFNYGELDSEPDAVSLNAGDLSDYESQKSGSTEGLTLKSATLEFESGTSINVYYTLASGHNISEYTFRINGTEVTPVYNSSKKAYGVTVASVASNELQNMYEFTAVRRGTAETLTLRYGAYSFAYSKLSNSSTAEALQNLMKAMYWYNQAAVAYFNS